MRDAWHLYLHYVSISLRSQLQYPTSFIMMVIGHMATTAIDFLGIWGLFARFGSLQDWTLPEVALFYGMVHLAFAISEAAARGFDIFYRQVKSGDFDRILLRPRSAVLQVIGTEFQLMRIGRFMQGLVVLLWGAKQLEDVLNGRAIFLIAASIIGGAFLFSGLFVLQATLSFWSVDSLELVNTVTYGGVQAAQVPVTIYRKRFRNFFIWIVPLATINYFPLTAILHRPDPLGTPIWIAWLSPVLGLAFFLLCLRIWTFGVKHYHSTGS